MNIYIENECPLRAITTNAQYIYPLFFFFSFLVLEIGLAVVYIMGTCD